MVTDWMKAAGYLTIAYSGEVGKETTMPTEKDRELGIYTEVRSVPGNTYLAVIYNQNAQEFIVRNLERIVSGEMEQPEPLLYGKFPYSMLQSVQKWTRP